MTNVIPLSLAAHEKALVSGSLVPGERPELMCWPMQWTTRGPIFDVTRMREDQVWDLTSRLEKLAGRASWGTTEDAVTHFMLAYGRSGQRVRDVCDYVSATKPIVLKYLRGLVADGKVRIMEETTRGDSGSRRKRYYWIEPEQTMIVRAEQASDLIQDGNAGETGIKYHGTGVQGVSCRCGACYAAIFDALCDEERSRVREAGETGLRVDLERARLRSELQIMQLEVDGDEIRAIL